MQLITWSVLFVMCILMFFVSREKKLGFILVTNICLSLVNITFIPLGQSLNLIVVFFLLSEFKYISSILAELKGVVVYKIAVLMTIATFLLWVASPHYRMPNKIVQMLCSELFVRYFLIIYSFVCLENLKGLKTIYKYSSIATLVLIFFGVTNFIDGYSKFVNDVGVGITTNTVNESLGMKYAESTRFRVQAMFINAFDYGYMCIALFLFHTYGFIKRIIPRYIYYIICAGTIFGVLTSGCRTNIICFIICLPLFFILCSHNNKRVLDFAFILFVGCLILYEYVPFVQEKIELALTAFSNERTVSGQSSIYMRSIQFAAALEYFWQSPILGNGLAYYLIDLGWGEDGMNTLKDIRLMGLEGVHLNLMIERGIVGIFFYYFFLFVVINFFYKKKYVDKETYALGTSVFVAYILFSHLTGELHSPIPTFLILGITMKLIYLQEKHIEDKHE